MKAKTNVPSFSRTAKERVCASAPRTECCRRAWLCGFLLYSKHGADGGVCVKSDSEQIMRRISGYLSEFAGFERYKEKDSLPEQIYVEGRICEGLCTVCDGAVFVCENCKRYFLGGVFVAAGTVSDPEKGYRLEMVFQNEEDMLFCESLLADFSLFPLKTRRKGKYVLYIKAGESIEDFLGLVGAQTSAFIFMNARIEKDIRNNANRMVNCDSHNIARSTGAGKLQADAAAYLESVGVLGSLPDELRETAVLRMLNPELPLAELAQMHEPPISKSGLNHRLKRLTEKAAEERRARGGD